MLILSVLLSALGLVLLIPVLWFCIQVLCACLAIASHRRSPGHSLSNQHLQSVPNEKPLHVAILIPAHNESIHLVPTLQSIQAQACPRLRILVVADNCTDDTARIARTHGAEVIERINPRLRGKGYALDFGVRHLAGHPPDVVIILDADCLLEQGTLHCLASATVATGRPVQALYLMGNPDKTAAGVKARIAEFAWRVKNHARPLGLHLLGLPCQLTGSGMAFPWHVLQGVPLATGEIVEDMKLGVMLAERGYAPVFCEQALVVSSFPTNAEAVKSQRTRWEHGHLAMIFREGLPKLAHGLLRRDRALFFLALDLCIPPLALLVMLSALWAVLASLYAVFSGDLRLPALAGTGFMLLAISVSLAWHSFGRDVISAQELLKAPVYILSKLSLYAGFLVRRQVDWVRSRRDDE
ncbi:MAG TPA: glycosyltransferase family 2 protein [Limnobacter sp.]|nr:glycosyltransferase family 2 protein [Limnobacter sp.]